MTLDNGRISGRYVRGSRVVVPGTGEIVQARKPNTVDKIAGYVQFLPGGMRVRRSSLGGDPPPESGGLRGVVVGMSRDSRRRLLDKLMAVDWDLFSGAKGRSSSRAFFVTVTYPGDWHSAASVDWRQWKAHLKALRKRLERWLASRGRALVGAVWKLEFQKRGAPHFHFVMLLDASISRRHFLAWLLEAWAGVVNAGGADFDKHKRYGADVVPVYGGGGGLMGYVSKYLAKETEGESVPADIREEGTGRVWGIWGELPQRDLLTVAVYSWRDWCEFIRRVRACGGEYSRYLADFEQGRVFGDGAEMMNRLLSGLGVRYLRLDGVRLDGEYVECEDGFVEWAESFAFTTYVA